MPCRVARARALPWLQRCQSRGARAESVKASRRREKEGNGRVGGKTRDCKNKVESKNEASGVIGEEVFAEN